MKYILIIVIILSILNINKVLSKKKENDKTTL